MPMISFAQNYEDVLLRRLFPDTAEGFYIDVGASHPVHHSVTKHFYDRGWRGINVEPIPMMFAELIAQRPRDVNLNLAVSDREGSQTFFEAPGVYSWSISADLLVDGFGARPEDVAPREVPVATLAAICLEHVHGTIDFLKVDAEDHESAVLRGADWERWRPRAVVIEGATRPWEPILLEARYLHAAFDGINHYYIRIEDRDLLPRLASPVNVTDDFVQHEATAAADRLRAERDEARGEIDALRGRLSQYDDLGPTSIRVARRLRSIARRHRGLSDSLRPILRRAFARARPATRPIPPTPAERDVRGPRVEVFGLEIAADDVVLDLGSGTGGDSMLAGSVGAEVFAVNFDAAELEQLGQQMADVPARSFRAVLCDCNEGPIPLPDGAATVVLAKEIMEHLDAPDRFLVELARLGRPGARYLITVPDPASEALLREVAPEHYWRKPLHQHIFSHERLDGMIRAAGLEIERRSSTGAYWSMFWMLRELVGTQYYPGHPVNSTPPPEIAAWDLIWEAIRTSPRGAALIEQLDALIPKSQIIHARKPTARGVAAA